MTTEEKIRCDMMSRKFNSDVSDLWISKNKLWCVRYMDWYCRDMWE